MSHFTYEILVSNNKVSLTNILVSNRYSEIGLILTAVMTRVAAGFLKNLPIKLKFGQETYFWLTKRFLVLKYDES